MNVCPFCGSKETWKLVRIDAKTVEYICEDCGCTFDINEPQMSEPQK